MITKIDTKNIPDEIWLSNEMLEHNTRIYIKACVKPDKDAVKYVRVKDNK